MHAVPALHAQLGPLEVSSWLQYASSVGGLIALAFWVRGWMRRTPRVARRSGIPAVARVAAWIGVAAVFVLAGGVIELIGVSAGISPISPARIFVAVTIAGGTAGLVGALICLAWWIARLGARTPRPAGEA